VQLFVTRETVVRDKSLIAFQQGFVQQKITACLLATLLQVQTLNYLGPAGTARKRTAAASAQGDVAADAEAAAAAPAAEEGGSKKGGKRGKRRKRGAAAAEAAEDEGAAAAEKENELPGAAAADAKKAAAVMLEQPEVRPAMLQSYGRHLHISWINNAV
jgi:hypothetical protein